MNNEIFGLFLTLFLGIFILIGSLIVFFAKNNNKFICLSIGMAFGVMLTLSITSLIPEVFEIFGNYKWYITTLIIIVLSLLGIIILKLFDIFIPHHEHKEHIDEKNLHHIGIVSSVALILHNIIEGMALYSVFSQSIKTGLLLSIGVGLHNIPLGMIIASAFYKSNKSIKKTLLISFGISISTFIGGVIMLILSNVINNTIMGIFIGITLGMIIYIALFELLPHIKEEQNKRLPIVGIFIGIILILVSTFFHHH